MLVPSALSLWCPQASLARQLCRQQVIAGQHLLEDPRTQNARKLWTLAGQQITVIFNRFLVRGSSGRAGPGSGSGQQREQ